MKVRVSAGVIPNASGVIPNAWGMGSPLEQNLVSKVVKPLPYHIYILLFLQKLGVVDFITPLIVSVSKAVA